MAAPERLQVGAVGERDLDLDEHVALRGRLGPGDVLEPQVAGAVEDRAPSSAQPAGGVRLSAGLAPGGSTLTERAPPSATAPSRNSRSASSNRSSGSTVGSGRSSAGRSRDRLLHVVAASPSATRRPSARAGRQPSAGSVPGVGEEQHRAARLDRGERRPRRPPGAQSTAASTGPSGATPGPAADCRSTANTVSPRRSSTAPKSRPMKPLPTTSTRPRGTRSAPRRTQASGSTYVPRASSTVSGSSTQPAARTRSAKPPGTIVGLGKPLAGRLVPGEAAAAGAAAGVVDQGDAAAVGGRGDDLVPEHGPGRGDADLLDVRAAEPAGEHAARGRRAAEAPRCRRGGAPRRSLGRPRAPAYRRAGVATRRRNEMAVKLHRCRIMWAKVNAAPVLATCRRRSTRRVSSTRS